MNWELDFILNPLKLTSPDFWKQLNISCMEDLFGMRTDLILQRMIETFGCQFHQLSKLCFVKQLKEQSVEYIRCFVTSVENSQQHPHTLQYLTKQCNDMMKISSDYSAWVTSRVEMMGRQRNSSSRSPYDQPPLKKIRQIPMSLPTPPRYISSPSMPEPQPSHTPNLSPFAVSVSSAFGQTVNTLQPSQQSAAPQPLTFDVSQMEPISGYNPECNRLFDKHQNSNNREVKVDLHDLFDLESMQEDTREGLNIFKSKSGMLCVSARLTSAWSDKVHAVVQNQWSALLKRANHLKGIDYVCILS